MDTSKFKDVIQNVFKNYSSLLVPAVIGLFAVLLFIPTQLMSGKLKKQIMNESITKRGKRIQSLRNSAVARDQHIEERKYQRAYKNDANEIALLAKQSAQRQLLSYKIFPEPKDMSAFVFEDFGQQFREVVRGLLARVNARDCPTDIELERGLEGLSKGRSRVDRRSDRLNGRGVSRSRLTEAKATIEDVLCREKAESASVYANPTDLSGYEFWKEYEATSWADTIKDCWYWQLGYWIIEDVVDAVDALNTGSNSVFTSPVKRLLGVSFATGGKTSRSRAGGKAADDKPKYVLSIEDVLIRPCTGRFSKGDIDVVHFNVVVVVSAKAILPFMQRLCSAKEHKFRGWDGEAQEQLFKHNQITILESGIESIDREDSTHRLYRYGDDAVVELDLICEYIFDRAGYDKIKPEFVKESVEEVLKKLEEEKAKAERRQRRTKTTTETKTKSGKKSRRELPELP